jgi:peptidoglycan/LPS O-acetylase OafA/YrhL
MGLIRVILAISVVFQHSPWRTGDIFVGGQLAVQTFYIISGFLISHILLSKDAYRNPLKFYYNRFLRIYPIYYAIAFITLIGAYFVFPEFFSVYRLLSYPLDAFLVISNTAIFGLDWLMFLGISGNELQIVSDFKHSDILLYRGILVGQAWTLGVELSFYLIAPVVVRSKKLLFGLLAISAAIKIYLFATGISSNDPWGCRFFPSELSFFLLGVISNQYLLPFWKKHVLMQPKANYPRYATIFASFVLMTFLLLPFDRTFTIPLLFAMIFIILPLTFIYQNDSPFDRSIGELSYPIYIGHMVAIRAVTVILNKWNVFDPLIITSLNVAVALIFAYFLNELLSKPIEKYRKRVARDDLPDAKGIIA